MLVLALKNCLNFLSIKTKRGNNPQAKCVSENSPSTPTSTSTCSFLLERLQNGFDAFLLLCKSLQQLVSGLVPHRVVIFVPLLQIRPTWTGTPPCAYFLLARATTWHDVCAGAEVRTENRCVAVKCFIHLFAFTGKELDGRCAATLLLSGGSSGC